MRLEPNCRWRFAHCEYDSGSRQLSVHGDPVNIESKPIEVLEQFLAAPSRTLLKDELKDAVWGVGAIDESLTTAIFKLRIAIGGKRDSVIQTIHGHGYRLVASVERIGPERAEVPQVPTFNVHEPVPEYADGCWRFSEPLDRRTTHRVWLARHIETHEIHLFKFAFEDTGPALLRHELAVFRILRQRLGQAAPVVTIHACRFDKAPYFLECEYGGPDLRRFFEENQAAEMASTSARLALLASIAEATEAVHAAGLLHNNLRPEHVLVSPASDNDAWRVKLCGFSLSTLQEGFNDETGDSSAVAGRSADIQFLQGVELQTKNRIFGRTPSESTYAAEEFRSEKASPSVTTDIYSLGVLLYQLACGDLDEHPLPGWEARVPDDLIRRDIADTANRNPSRRLITARALADRLLTLDMRRADEKKLRDMSERAANAEKSLARERAQRPWIIAASVALLIGLVGTLAFYQQAVAERNVAMKQRRAAEATNRFLSKDLLAQGNPFSSKASANVTLLAAMKQAASKIDGRFAGDPTIAGGLHFTIGLALDNNFDWNGAEHEYEKAAHDFERAEGLGSRRAVLARLRDSFMFARSNIAGGIEHARDILQNQEPLAVARRQRDTEVIVWILATKAVLEAQTNKLEEANSDSHEALALAKFDPDLRIVMLHLCGLVALRMGNGPELERTDRDQIRDILASQGPDSPDLLTPEMQLMESFFIQRRFQEAVSEADKIYPKFVSKVGQTNEATLQILSTKAAAEGSMGRLDDAIRDDFAVQKIAHDSNPHSLFALGTLSDVALSYGKKKDWGNCERYARQGLTAINSESHPFAALKDAMSEALAICLVRDGDQRTTAKLSEAENLLTRMDVAAARNLSGDEGMPVDVSTMLAQIAFARGDYGLSKKRLGEAEERLKAVLPPDVDRVASIEKLRQELKQKVQPHNKLRILKKP